ncbi:hypothetical protein TcCL_ESM08620 [Trypanosoma cruzi]|nr:hypothetical protein TcCL_ESM08620 [Trypanosoma cruzi]
MCIHPRLQGLFLRQEGTRETVSGNTFTQDTVNPPSLYAPKFPIDAEEQLRTDEDESADKKGKMHKHCLQRHRKAMNSLTLDYPVGTISLPRRKMKRRKREDGDKRRADW